MRIWYILTIIKKYLVCFVHLSKYIFQFFAILSIKSKVSFKIRNLFSSINGVIYDVLRTWFVSCMICMSNLPFLFYKFIPSFLWLAAFYRWSATHTTYSHALFPICSKCNGIVLRQKKMYIWYEFNLRTMGIRQMYRIT